VSYRLTKETALSRKTGDGSVSYRLTKETALSRKTGDGSVPYHLTKEIAFPGKTKYSVQPTNQRRNYKPGQTRRTALSKKR
jgi:hypothetical protein